MKKLEDIVITKTFTHKERFEGKIKEIIRTKNIPLTVNSINSGLRFVHLLIDYYLIRVIIYLLEMFVFSGPLAVLIGVLLFPIYFTLMEYYFQQTLGKIITGTVVIDNYTQKPSFRICLLRSLIRLVPFEPFSCLSTPSRGWHDKWTDTYVVKKGYAKELEALLKKHNETISA